MIVADANLIVYLFLSGEHSSQAETILAKDPEWAAPLLWRSEFRNVLVAYLRKGIFDLAVGNQIMDEAMLLMAGREYEVASLSVLSLAADSGCSAYDCEYVALAQDLGCSLVTLDRQILERFPEIAVSLVDYAGDEGKTPHSG